MNMCFLKNIILFVFCCFISACGDDYQWTEDIANLTNKDLNGWLQKAPFGGKINKEDGMVLMTNDEQVFPFKGKYVNEDGDIPYKNTYQSAHTLFNDPKWGSTYVLATLLYTPEKLHYKDSYEVSGDIVFSANAISERYSANLSETQVAIFKSDYQTIIYRANANFRTYLFATYQKGVLLFEVAIPWQDDDVVIAKLKEVNRALNLNIPEWNNLTTEDLTINHEPVTFWKDPYRGMFDLRFTSRLEIKAGVTPFNVDYGDEHLHYRTEEGEVVMQFEEVPTKLNQTDYYSNHSSAPMTYTTRGLYNTTQTVYVSEKVQGEKILGEGETFFKGSDSILKIHYQYPKTDKEAAKNIRIILENLRIRSVLP